jgi:uncharacterized protein (TIGR03067 family)
MKTIAAFVLGLGMIGSLELLAQEKKEDKKEEKKEDKKDDKKVEPPVLDGKYKLVAGKISDKAIGDDAKKWEYTFIAGKITIRNPDDKREEKKEDKKEEKKEEKKESKKDDDGKKDEKKDGKKDDDAKKDNKALIFSIGYKLDANTNPINIEMEILDGPEGTKGIKTSGIVELKGDVLKLAYIMEKDKRPKTFDGKEGLMFELHKLK